MPSDFSGKAFSRQRQLDIFLGALRGKRRTIPISFDKLRVTAKKHLFDEAYAYIYGSAGRESTKGDADAPQLTWNAIKALIEMAKNYPGGFWNNLLSEHSRRAVKTFIECYSRPSLTWDDLSFLRSLTDLPILLIKRNS